MGRLRTALRAAASSWLTDSDGGAGWYAYQDHGYPAETNLDPRNYRGTHALQLAPMHGAVDYVCRSAKGAQRIVEEEVGGEWRPVAAKYWPDWCGRPNNHQLWMDFADLLVRNMLVMGNGFVKVLDRGDGWPRIVASLPREYVSGDQSTSEWLSTPTERFVYYVNGEPARPYTRYERDGELLHCKLLTRGDIMWGTSPLDLCAPGLRASLGAEAFAEMFFQTGGTAGEVYYQKPPSSKDFVQSEEKFRATAQAYRDQRRDPDTRHLPFFMRGEYGVHESTKKPGDSQLDESRHMAWRQASAISGVPRPLIGGDESAAWANGIRQLARGTHLNVVQPMLDYVSEALSEMLPADMRLRLRREMLSDSEPLEVMQYWTMAVDAGIVLPSVAQAALGLPINKALDDRPAPGMSDRTGGRSRSGRPVGSQNRQIGPPAERRQPAVQSNGTD